MNGVNDNDHMKYDVFISAKSEDYDLAEGVFEFLVGNGLSVFLANAELRKIGMSQYAEAIDLALDGSKHMIVVASCIDYIRSPFVHYEWSVFSNDLKSGYRTGNLLTILVDGISLRELPPSLRHHQSYRFDDYKANVLSFLSGKANASCSQTSRRRHSFREECISWRRMIALAVFLGMIGCFLIYMSSAKKMHKVDTVVHVYKNMDEGTEVCKGGANESMGDVKEPFSMEKILTWPIELGSNFDVSEFKRMLDELIAVESKLSVVSDVSMPENDIEKIEEQLKQLSTEMKSIDDKLDSEILQQCPEFKLSQGVDK